MSKDSELEEFATRLQTQGISEEVMNAKSTPTLSMRYSPTLRMVPPQQPLHTLPELQIEVDSEQDISPDLIPLETLGEGGMGLVRLANQVSLDREVAVKTIRTDDSDTHTDITRTLLQEAYVTGYLEHPNIIPIYLVGRTPNKTPLIVMKRVEGDSWRQRLHEQRQGHSDFDLEAEIKVLIQVTNAVRFAHSRGVIHQDIKTENVMIGDFDEVYLLDWGIAIYLHDDKPLLPGRDDILSLRGTPGYMAPEMAHQRVDEIDERTDIFLLGATLHDVLTGEPRHEGRTLLEILYSAHRSEPFDYGDDVPEELAKIANKACHPDKEKRFATAVEFRDALRDFLKHRESIALAHSADAKRRELNALLNAPERDIAALHDTYGECHFGYLEALRMWPENTAAIQGLQQCLEAMANHHLDNHNLDAARSCILDLIEPRPELTKRADELAQQLQGEQQDLQRLKEMEQDLDLRTSSSARSLLVLIFGAIWTATSLYAALRHGGEAVTNAEQLHSHMVSGIRNTAIATAGIIAFRKRIFANTANARLAYLLLTFQVALASVRWSTWYLDENILLSRLAENALAVLLLIAIGLVSDLRICLFALIYVVVGAITLLWPEYYLYTRPAAIALTFGAFAWVWSPSQLEKKVSL